MRMEKNKKKKWTNDRERCGKWWLKQVCILTWMFTRTTAYNYCSYNCSFSRFVCIVAASLLLTVAFHSIVVLGLQSQRDGQRDGSGKSTSNAVQREYTPNTVAAIAPTINVEMSTHSPFGNGKWYKTQIALNTHFILVCRRWFTNANATIKNCLSKQRQRDDDDETHLYFKMCNFFGFSLSVIFVFISLFLLNIFCVFCIVLHAALFGLLARAQITRKLNKSAKLFPLIRFFFCLSSRWVNVVVHSQQSTATSCYSFGLFLLLRFFLFTSFNARQPKNLFKDEPFHYYYYYRQVYLLRFSFLRHSWLLVLWICCRLLILTNFYRTPSLALSLSFNCLHGVFSAVAAAQSVCEVCAHIFKNKIEDIYKIERLLCAAAFAALVNQTEMAKN